jgi:hypothetical protein
MPPCPAATRAEPIRARGRPLRYSTPSPLSLSQFQYAVTQTALGLGTMQAIEREHDRNQRMGFNALTAVKLYCIERPRLYCTVG